MPYKSLLHAVLEDTNHTIYTAYFSAPEQAEWKNVVKRMVYRRIASRLVTLVVEGLSLYLFTFPGGNRVNNLITRTSYLSH